MCIYIIHVCIYIYICIDNNNHTTNHNDTTNSSYCYSYYLRPPCSADPPLSRAARAARRLPDQPNVT